VSVGLAGAERNLGSIGKQQPLVEVMAFVTPLTPPSVKLKLV